MNKKWVFISSIVAVFLLLASYSFAGLTITSKKYASWGNKKVRIFTLGFDSSYPNGGESLAPGTIGLQKNELVFFTGTDGYTFEYDYDNEKVKVFSQAPPIIYEEKHTSGTSIVLNYPVAWIISVTDSNGHPMRWNDRANSGVSFGGHEFALTEDIENGALSGITTSGGNETIYVTYVTQAWTELYRLLVQRDPVPGTSGTSTEFTSGATPIAVGYAAFIETGVTNAYPLDWNDTPGASEYAVSLYSSTSPYSGIKPPNGSSGSSTLYVTYLKAPATSATTLFVIDRYESGQTAVSVQTNSTSYAGLWKFDKPLLVPSYTGHFTVNGSATPWQVGLRDTTAVSPFVRPNWGDPVAYSDGQTVVIDSTNVYEQAWGTDDSGVTPTNMGYIQGRPWEIPNLQKLEVPAQTDLSGLTDVRVFVVGY